MTTQTSTTPTTQTTQTTEPSEERMHVSYAPLPPGAITSPTVRLAPEPAEDDWDEEDGDGYTPVRHLPTHSPLLASARTTADEYPFPDWDLVRNWMRTVGKGEETRKELNLPSWLPDFVKKNIDRQLFEEAKLIEEMQKNSAEIRTQDPKTKGWVGCDYKLRDKHLEMQKSLLYERTLIEREIDRLDRPKGDHSALNEANVYKGLDEEIIPPRNPYSVTRTEALLSDPNVATIIRNRFSYNPETGELFKGRIPLSPSCRTVYLKGGYSVTKSRFIWWLLYNEWPKQRIIHVNGVKKDFSQKNLTVARELTARKSVHAVPDKDRLEQLYVYNPETGEFLSRRTGKPLKAMDPQKKYFIVAINRRQYALHRIAFYMLHGRWPGRLYCLNGDKTDLRASNWEENQGLEEMVLGDYE
jgi:hypothetical protein